MSSPFENLVRFNTTTTGTGPLTVGSAVSGFFTPAQAGTPDQAVRVYAIRDGANSEMGWGIYTSSGTTLTRNVTVSNTGGTAGTSSISLSGSAQVFFTPRAGDIGPPLNSPLKRLAQMGDDHIVCGYATSTQVGYYSNAIGMSLALSGGRLYLDPRLDKAVAGNRTDQMVARFDADIMANLDKFDILILSGGANDYSSVTPANTIANIKWMMNRVLPFGKIVVYICQPPRNDGIAQAGLYQLAYVNQSISEYCRTQNRIIYIDDWRDGVNPTDAAGGPQTVMTTDGLHRSSFANWFCARQIWSALESVTGPAVALWTNPNDVYSATDNPTGNAIVNPRLTGTSGSVAGTGGVLPGSYNMNKWQGTSPLSAITSSVVANTDGSTGNYMQTSFSASAASANETFDINCYNDTAPVGIAVGDNFRGQIELEMPAPLVNIKDITLTLLVLLNDYSTSLLMLSHQFIANKIPSITIGQKVLLQTPIGTLPTGGVDVLFILSQTYDATTTASGIIRMSAPVIRKIV